MHSLATSSLALVPAAVSNAGMRTIDDIRNERLQELIREAGSIKALAERLGKSHAQISNLKTRAKQPNGTRKTIGNALAREIEETMGKPAGWMDSDPLTCCTGTPTEYREQPAAPAVAVPDGVWRGAANRLREHCKASGVTLDAETFLIAVEAAVEQAGADIDAADKALKHWLPVIMRGRGIGHAAP